MSSAQAAADVRDALARRGERLLDVARSTPGGKVLPFHLASRDRAGGPPA